MLLIDQDLRTPHAELFRGNDLDLLGRHHLVE
jgi:hypothetical protein